MRALADARPSCRGGRALYWQNVQKMVFTVLVLNKISNTLFWLGYQSPRQARVALMGSRARQSGMLFRLCIVAAVLALSACTDGQSPDSEQVGR